MVLTELMERRVILERREERGNVVFRVQMVLGETMECRGTLEREAYLALRDPKAMRDLRVRRAHRDPREKQGLQVRCKLYLSAR